MYGAPPGCIEATYSGAEPHCTETYRGLTKRRLADLRLIKHHPWFALYPPDEFVSGIKGAFDVEMGALPIPSIPLI